MSAADRIVVTEVSLRDGLQNQPVFVETGDKLRLADLLLSAGIDRLEATSFVSPKAVPQMADAPQIVARLGMAQGVVATALAMNRRGLERAIASGATSIATVVAATHEMNRRNINMSRDAAREEAIAVLDAAHAAGLTTRAYVAVAFECPFEGTVAADEVVRLAELFAGTGTQEIVIADTIGAAGPAQVKRLLRAILERLPAERIGLHFHDTRGLAVANVQAALDAGIRRFDSSAGGLGGCPFAPGAAGNLATEDLVVLAETNGMSTGIDLSALCGAIDFAASIIGRALGGRSLPWARRRSASCDVSRPECAA